MRFAYLIMAHDNQKQLEVLLRSLDYPENELFLHIDKKSTIINDNELYTIIKKAKIHIFRKYNVYWADISQTKCQLYLLKTATKSFHDYYHLISGHDLLIKPHNEIVSFFRENNGKEFVHFESNDFSRKEGSSYYHFSFYFSQRTNCKRIKQFLKNLDKKIIRKQMKLGIRRDLYCGANWFSITHKLARDLLENKKEIIKKIRFTTSSDECLLQSFIRMVSKNEYQLFDTAENDYRSIMRYIDWERGNPYVWRINDFNELVNSEKLFARKFDENIDMEIINKISQYSSVNHDCDNLKDC